MQRAPDPKHLVFLHPVEGSPDTWKEQLHRFPGSGAPEFATGTLNGMARQAAECGPAHYVGLGMGGVVALHLYRKLPEVVRSLVLVCTWARHPEGRDRIRTMETSLRGMTMSRWSELSRPLLVAPETPLDFAAEVGAVEARKVASLYADQYRVSYEADLRGVVPDVPTLVIGGERDQIAPVATCVEPLHRQIPGSRLLVLPGAYHYAHVDRHFEFNRVLAEWVENPDPRRRS